MVVKGSTRSAALWEGALAVLRANDLGGWTKPAPRLYPHQWSWDSAFIAIGLAHVDVDRALRELEVLFGAQWADGRVPHIVFNPAARDYFPGPERWATAALSAAAPRAPGTSGLVQPPVHAIAAWRIAQADPERRLEGRLRALYPKLVAWHRYLATRRDVDGSGLMVIYHPWESGADNSPRWDEPLSRVEVGDVPPYVRHDLKHVADVSERPTHAEYDRYLWLVECLKAVRYDDARVHEQHPFLVQDVFMSAIFAVAGEDLDSLGAWLGVEGPERDEVRAWSRRAADGVRAAWVPDERLALDRDARAGYQPVRVTTCAGLAPILLADLDPAMESAVREELFGPRFAGGEGMAYPVVPSTAPGSPGFHPRTYWRGPSWPIVNWLYWWGLRRHGRAAEAARLRQANLALFAAPGARFAEYFEPHTGAPLGSLDQSWTAAVALDWLVADDSPMLVDLTGMVPDDLMFDSGDAERPAPEAL